MYKNRNTARLRAALLASISLGYALPAAAQEAAKPAVAEGDIVVTALKRDTTLQQTPISISAITGDTLVKAGTNDIAGISTPSLSFVDAGPSQRRVVIRGIQAAGEPTVGVYYDEVPVTGSVGSTNDAGANTPELRLFDVQRVEVLRGPQGTLYGSGSMGGTLRIIYNKPDFESKAAADATLSGTEDGGFNYVGNVMVNTPISDTLALRATGFYGHDAGYIDNVSLGINNINQVETYGGRVQLRYRPTTRLTVDLAAFINRTRSDTNSWTLNAGRYNVDALTRQPLRDDFDLYSGTVAWDLGAAKLTGVVSYSHRDLSTAQDVTRFIATNRTPAACARLVNANVTCGAATLASFFALVDDQIPSALAPQQAMDTVTTELRLSSRDGSAFGWTVGGFFSQRDSDIANPQVYAVAATGQLQPNRTPITVRLIDDRLKQLAAFGEVSWDITDALNLTAGLRYFKYDRTIVGETPIPNILVGARLTPSTRVAASEDGTTVKLNASYKITRDIMLYAEAAQGFRPGGVNQVIGLDASLAPYRSDSVWNYEVGIKTSLFDRVLTLNVDAFQIDWSDIQITGRTANGAFSFITNAGAARVRGVELEAALRPFRGLTLQANGARIDAVLTENQTTTAVTAPGLAGDRIPYVPQFSGALNAEYDWSLGGGLAGLVRGDVRHVSGSWSDFRPNGTFARRVDAYDLVNVRAGIQSDDERWGVFLFATNLLNDVAITRATSSAILTSRTIVTSAQPRTIGVNLRTRF